MTTTKELFGIDNDVRWGIGISALWLAMLGQIHCRTFRNYLAIHSWCWPCLYRPLVLVEGECTNGSFGYDWRTVDMDALVGSEADRSVSVYPYPSWPIGIVRRHTYTGHCEYVGVVDYHACNTQ